MKSSVHYALVDGGTVTAPDNAVFDPINKKWVAENFGVPPDIEVCQDAASLANGGDPQLERAVKEALKLLEQQILSRPFDSLYGPGNKNTWDLRYIQSLLGHSSPKTTQIYTHITTKGFDQIKNPLDNLGI